MSMKPVLALKDDPVVKTMRAYLTLWKALDVHFAGHSLTEITHETVEDVTNELQNLAAENVYAWAEDPTTLAAEIENTLKRLSQKPKDEKWHAEARILKETFKDKALEYAKLLPDPPMHYRIVAAD